MRLTLFPNEFHRINSLHSELRSLPPPLEHANEIIIASNEIVGFPGFCTGEMQSIPRLDFDTLREPAGQCKDSGRWAYSMSTESGLQLHPLLSVLVRSEAVFVIQHERPNQLEYSSLCEFKDTFNRGSFESDSQLAVIIETSIKNVHVTVKSQCFSA